MKQRKQDPRERPKPLQAFGRKHPQHGWQIWIEEPYLMWVTSGLFDASDEQAEMVFSVRLTYEDTWAEPEEDA